MSDGFDHLPPTFGGLLHKLRKNANLTQRQLGLLIGYSESQINKLESGKRLPDPKAVASANFLNALKLDASTALATRLIALAHAAHRPNDRASGSISDGSAHNLPAQVSSFIGREHELGELKTLLLRDRLITLHGAGGSGKTRLATELALQVRTQFIHGVWLIELATVKDEAGVARAVADVLKVVEVPALGMLRSLAMVLQDQKMLLVLDNCEHVVAGCARLAETLLHLCPGLKVLATSREPLHVTGERSMPVPALSLPRPDEMSFPPQRLSEFEAVRLFLERTMAARNRTSIVSSAALVRAAAEICRKLDGMPLAIEIAAARAATIGVIETRDRLYDRFHLLVQSGKLDNPRQASLRTTIEWSIDLLTSKERILIKRLSVFVGGWTLEAAESVCSDSASVVLADTYLARAEIMDVLSALAEKSLVQVVDDDAENVRYGMLESIHEYARTEMRHRPALKNVPAPDAEADAARNLARRHAEWCLSLAQTAERQLFGHKQSIWLRRLHRELDNIRAALDFFVAANDADSARMLAGSLRRFWQTRGRTSEGRAWLTKALALDVPASAAANTRAYFTQAVLDIYLGDTAAARNMIKLASEAVLQTQDPWMTGQVFGGIVFRPVNDEQYVETRRRLETVMANAIQQGDTWLIGNVYHKLGSMEVDHGHLPEAQRLFGESSTYLEQAGDRIYSMLTFMWLGNIALRLDQYAEAERNYTAGLSLVAQIGVEYCEHIGIWTCLRGMAELAAHAQQPQRMATLLGATEYESERQGGMPRTWFPKLSMVQGAAHYIELSGEPLDTQAYQAAWQRGRGWTLENAIEVALETKGDSGHW